MNTMEKLKRRGTILLQRATRAIAVLAVCAMAMSAQAGASGRDMGGPRAFTYFNANLYVGAELLGALAVDPGDPAAVLGATSKIFADIVDSHPEIRMPAVAREIAAEQPEVVGLVEVYTVATAPVINGHPGEFTAVFDYLGLLKTLLEAAGANYNVAVVSTESDVVLPIIGPGGLVFGRLTDHEVILVRADLPPGHLRVSNPQTGHFSHYIQVPQLGISVYRGWCSLDVFTRGEQFTYVLAHPEQQSVPVLNYAQIMELVAGFANTTTPIILAGDFNADALYRDGTTSYNLFGQTGFTDAWLQLNPLNPDGGLTWGHDAALDDPNEPFTLRIDLVLYRGATLVPSSLQVVDLGLGQTQAPRWATDHAAVSGSFTFAPPAASKTQRGN